MEPQRKGRESLTELSKMTHFTGLVFRNLSWKNTSQWRLPSVGSGHQFFSREHKTNQLKTWLTDWWNQIFNNLKKHCCHQRYVNSKDYLSAMVDVLTFPLPITHDGVIKWKHFLRYWPFVWVIRRSPVESPHKSQWRGALMFSLIRARINGWVNNREAGDLRSHRAHYDVIVMSDCLPSRSSLSLNYIVFCGQVY